MNERRDTERDLARERRVALGWVAGQLRWESRLDGLRGATTVPGPRTDADEAIAALADGERPEAPEVEPAA